jgi:hypothetical protein
VVSTNVLSLVQYDDLFIFAPSFTIAEEHGWSLDEGKYVGTAKEVDLVFLDKDKTMDAFLRPEDYATQRKKGVTVGKRALKRVKRRTYAELLPLVMAHDRGETWNTDFKKDAERVMKRAWRDVFVAGVRSSGIRGQGPHAPIEFSAEDEKWLKGAIAHEMRFLNKFVAAVTEQTYKMPLDRRTGMYIDALESFYDSARVMGLPATSVFRWTGKKDKRVCESCQYLHDHNPYHKKNLPTTPRSGLTVCLTNCRDRLLVRNVGSDAALKVLQEGRTREQHIRALREIKRKHHAPRR